MHMSFAPRNQAVAHGLLRFHRPSVQSRIDALARLADPVEARKLQPAVVELVDRYNDDLAEAAELPIPFGAESLPLAALRFPPMA